MVGSACGSSVDSCGRFCVDEYGRKMASVAEKMFSYLIQFINFILSMRFAQKTLCNKLYYYSTQNRLTPVNFLRVVH
jgi:hypothetical protein